MREIDRKVFREPEEEVELDSFSLGGASEIGGVIHTARKDKVHRTLYVWIRSRRRRVLLYERAMLQFSKARKTPRI